MRVTILLLALLPLILFAETHIPAGPVSGTWTQAGSPYYIEGDISIGNTSTLTIEPGVEVLFQGYYRLLCEGQLLAVGTEMDSIIFTNEDTVECWDGIDFVDLDFNGMDSSRLVLCELSYGKSSRHFGTVDYSNGGGIMAQHSSKLSIINSCFYRNRTADKIGANGIDNIQGGPPPTPGEFVETGKGGAIYLFASDAIIQDCLFEANSTGNATGGMGGSGDQNGQQVVAQYFYAARGANGGDGLSGNGAAVYAISSEPIITNCFFRQNVVGFAVGGQGGLGGRASTLGYAAGGDGGDGGNAISGRGGAVYFELSNASLVNCLFLDNKIRNCCGGWGGNGGDALGGNGGETGNGGNGGNAINGLGNAIGTDLNSTITVINSTFTHHDSPCNAAGGQGGQPGSIWWGPPSGIWGVNGSSQNYRQIVDDVDLTNCIVYDNINYVIPSANSVTYSCVENNFTGIGNIYQNPVFTSGPQGYLYLGTIFNGALSTSPCIDAGSPVSIVLAGTTNIDEFPDVGIVDMGYHYPLPVYREPTLVAAPSGFTVQSYIGNPPEPQPLLIFNGGTGLIDTFNIQENIPWLQISPLNGGNIPPHDSIIVSFDISGLTAGTYSDIFIIDAGNIAGSPDTIPVFLNLNGFAGALSGVIPGDSTYYVDGDLIVNLGDTLIIQAGAVLEFTGDYEFIVEGLLFAEGSIGSEIIFRPFPSDSSWQGFYFNGFNLSKLDFCEIMGSSTSGIMLNNTFLEINNCFIHDNNSDGNGGGINCINSNLEIDSTIFDSNVITDLGTHYGGALFLNNSNAYIENSVFSNNHAFNGAMRVDNSQAYLQNCVLYGNADLPTAVGVNGNGYYTVVNSIIMSNSDTAFYTTPLCTIKFCDIYDNQFFSNNCYYPSGLGQLITVNTNGDPCDIYYNIFLNPQFVDPVNGDFYLISSSPCIDAGDPTSPLDPDSTIADIGAYYFDQSAAVESPAFSILPLAFSIVSFPNPFNNSLKIAYAVPAPGNIEIQLYDITGRLAAVIIDKYHSPGYYETTFAPDRLASGVYFLQMKGKNFNKTQKMVYLK